MRSPKNMSIIQIDITNACFNRCSNCTRFCGNHKQPFFMERIPFIRACESLYRFPNMVGIIGGEPTLHPQFEEFVKYYDNIIPGGSHIDNRNDPIFDFCGYRNINWSTVVGRKRGLWTSLGKRYAQHFELIRKVFEYQCVNDHKNAGRHHALMITRKELGIPDKEFYHYRDSCWVQNKWSATITPKGAFFCEVAGALDMLLDGPGGWPITDDWWQRPVEEFKDQLHWCELCSACLPVPESISHNNEDTVSPEWDIRLSDIGSTKKRTVFDLSNYDPGKFRVINTAEPYIDNNADRVGQDTSKPLEIGKINIIMVSWYCSDILALSLPYNLQEASRVIVVTTPDDIETQKVCDEHCGVECLLSDKLNLNGAVFNKGAMINDAIEKQLSYKDADWILCLDVDIVLPTGFKNKWIHAILNPACLYYADRVDITRSHVNKRIISDKMHLFHVVNPGKNAMPWGYFQLFNVRSSALTGNRPMSEMFISAGHYDREFSKRWHPERRFKLPVKCAHIEHGALGKDWHGRK